MIRTASHSSMGVKTHVRLAACAVAFTLASTQVRAAHAQSAWNPRDDQYRALGLVRARAEYRRAATELERTRQLQAKHMASDAELEARRADATRTQVDYLQQALAVAGSAPHVMIVRALKRRDDDGRPIVDVTLRSIAALSGEGASALDVLAADMPEMAGAARAGGGGAHELFVSLKAAPGLDGATISSPYERHVRRLPASGVVTLSFRLVREVDDVVVAVLSGDKLVERRVWLERGGGADRWRMTAAHESQDADLGAQVVYDLIVEHDGGRADAAHGSPARLHVTGLPSTVTHEFRDAATKARIAALGTRRVLGARPGAGGDASAGEERRALQLVISLPTAGDAAVALDRPLRFIAWAAPAGEGSVRNASTGKSDSTTERPPAVGAVALEVTPRGVPRAELRTANLYVEIAGGDSAVVIATVRNSGTRALRGVRLRVAPPDGWRVTQSAVVPALAVGAEQVMRATVQPPAGVEVGDYEARLKLEVASEAGRFQTEEKLMRIHVADASATRSVALLGLAALVAAAGILGAGRRLLRR